MGHDGIAWLGGLFLLVVAVVMMGMYFLPSIIAIARHHHQVGLIVVLNFFLGWTFIGWVVSLALAFSATSPGGQVTIFQGYPQGGPGYPYLPPPGPYQAPRTPPSASDELA